MSNALSVGPIVMINRIVDRDALPAESQLAKVAQLRLSLETAVHAKDAERSASSPDGVEHATPVNTGAAIDRLI